VDILACQVRSNTFQSPESNRKNTVSREGGQSNQALPKKRRLQNRERSDRIQALNHAKTRDDSFSIFHLKFLISHYFSLLMSATLLLTTQWPMKNVE